MNTYVAQVETSSGAQQFYLAAANIQDAQTQVEAVAKRMPEGAIRYTIQYAQPALSPKSTDALVDATIGLFACFIVGAIALYKVRLYFKG
jgi:hypothetical protein